jgi:hypothetical protein
MNFSRITVVFLQDEKLKYHLFNSGDIRGSCIRAVDYEVPLLGVHSRLYTELNLMMDCMIDRFN